MRQLYFVGLFGNASRFRLLSQRIRLLLIVSLLVGNLPASSLVAHEEPTDATVEARQPASITASTGPVCVASAGASITRLRLPLVATRSTASAGALGAALESSIDSLSAGAGSGAGVVAPTLSDLAQIAPPLDRTVATDFGDAVAFLYTGANAVQTGVTPGTIDRRYASVIRGCVWDDQGRPAAGAKVTIQDHPEFGETVVGADGLFHLVVNGGGTLVVTYRGAGALPAQRHVQVPWRDYVWAEEVVLVSLDRAVTPIDLTSDAPMQVARGSRVTDDDGTRRATLLFPRGTTAEMMKADGTTESLTTLNVRATEYTVGDAGPSRMPGALPPQSGYTYAVELSTDEALTRGAKLEGKDIVFNQPVWYYVENFLNFPVGTPVPTGYYDPDKAAWIPSDDGHIVQVIAIEGGLASLDTNGDGQADNDSALGITDAERAQLASLYAVGQSLWRVPLTHLSTWDCNWSFGPPLDAIAAAFQRFLDWFSSLLDSPCTSGGSIIECENQVLGEAVGLTGMSLALHYQSDRAPGRTAARTLEIPLSGATVPSSLKQIDLEIIVAGQRIVNTFPATPNQSTLFTWNGLDGFGRPLQGEQPVTARIGYVYDGVYQQPGSGRRSFAVPSGIPITGSRTRQEVTLWRELEGTVGGWDGQAQSLGGWSLSSHHVYDPVGQVLYQGDGQRRSVDGLQAILTTIAGTGSTVFNGDGIPALQAHINSPRGVTIGPDGSLYISEWYGYRIRRIDPNGVVTTVAGTGRSGFSGDGGPAIAAQLGEVDDVAFGSDGSLYIADAGNHRIRRVGLDGVITTVAGNGTAGFSGDGGLATAARLYGPQDLAIDVDGTIYIADRLNNRIRRVGPDGIITTVAGTGSAGYSGDGGPAVAARLNDPDGVALGPDGGFFVAEEDNNTIRRVGPDGIITTVAGSGRAGYSGDGGPATEAHLSGPSDVILGPDGSIFIAEQNSHVIRRVGSDGIITTAAGVGSAGFQNDGGPATSARLNTPDGVALGPDGSLYIADVNNHRVRRVIPPLPGFTATDIAIPSEDGGLLYLFNANGRHLRTFDTHTGAALYTFGYDAAGRLIGVTDGDGNQVTVERDGSGAPAAIVAPFGQRTTLTLDANGYFASMTNPAGERLQFVYTAGGLLTRMTDPRGNATEYAYDALGRLTHATNRVGGVQTLTRTATSDGYTATRTDPLGRVHTYQVTRSTTDALSRANTLPDGTIGRSQRRTDGTTFSLSPNGLGVSQSETADPRFGMLAPVAASQTITTPGGLRLATSTARTVTLADQSNPLALTSETETTTVNGRRYTSVYNAASRQFTLTTPAGRASRTTIDAQGRVLEEATAGLEPVRYTYDAQGRLTTVAQGSGADVRTTTLRYNAAGYLEATTDPLGQTTTFVYDAVGRVMAQTLPDGRVLGYAYDANGNLTTLTPPGRLGHVFTYTADDLPATYAPPDVGAGVNQTQYAYDAARALTRVIRPDGQTLDFAYDAGGRLATLTTPRGQTTYSYQAGTGNLASIAAPGGLTLNYTYDGGLLRNEVWSGPVAGTVSRVYDNNFRITSTSVNGGNTVAFQYDTDGLLTRAGALVLTRDTQNGLLTGTTLGSVSDAYTYNGFAEPQGYQARYSALTLYDVQYTRDALGRIVAKTENVSGTVTAYAYTYDTAGRLTEVRRDGALTEQYAYDANGNRTGATVRGVTIAATYDAQDRLLTYGDASYQYTANGELLRRTASGQTTTYQYDVQGNLIGVTLPDGTQVGYLIDGQNRRIGRTVNGVLVQAWLYADGLTPIAELDGAGNVVSRFVYGSRATVPDYILHSNGVTYRVITDQLGSPRLVVNVATSVVWQRLDYDAFGNVLLDTRPGFQPFGFASGLYDPSTGLVRFGARDYDAQVGRWTAKDPIGFADAANLYEYVSNDPVNMADPTGTIAWAPILAGAWLAAEFGLAVSDAVSTGQDLADPCLSFGEKLASAGLFVVGVVAPGGGYSTGYRIGPKIVKQIPKRGWSDELIQEAISNPVKKVPWRDTRHLPDGTRLNDPATAYYHRDGGYIIRNDVTGDIVQVSNRNDPNWVAPWD